MLYSTVEMEGRKEGERERGKLLHSSSGEQLFRDKGPRNEVSISHLQAKREESRMEGKR